MGEYISLMSYLLLIKKCAMRTCVRIEVSIDPVFLTSGIVVGEWSASHSGRFTFCERPSDAHCVVGCIS
jgi:hypothetical protein